MTRHQGSVRRLLARAVSLHSLRDRRATSSLEYVVLATVIAVALIGTFQFFAGTVGNFYTDLIQHFF